MRVVLSSAIQNPLTFLLFLTTISFGSGQAGAKEYIVKLKENINTYNIREINKLNKNLFKIMDTQKSAQLIKISTNKNDPSSMLKDYFDAEYVVENVMMHAFVEQNDPRRSEQWALDIVNANKAWDITQGDHQVVVAVIDTGLALNHEDIKDNLWVNEKEIANNGLDDDKNGYIDDENGWDFYGNDKNPTDETGARNPGHGTHCAGIIGASCNNNVGVCGISPKVSLMALRFLNKDGSGDLFSSTKAIEYAAKNGAHIISASWGASVSEKTAQPIIDAIKAAEKLGVIFVAAASNDGKSNDVLSIYPANAQTEHMLSIAASNNKDAKPTWSNFGRKVDIAAPGDTILSTIPGGYKELSGTSMATPLVAGIIALMKSIDINLTGAQARSILQSTGAEVNIETASNRRVDAHKALYAVANRQLTLIPASASLKPAQTLSFSGWGGAPPYKFVSLNPDIATIDDSGNLLALKEGSLSIEITDSNGAKATSVNIKIFKDGKPKSSACPIPNESLCELFCTIWPETEWCDD